MKQFKLSDFSSLFKICRVFSFFFFSVLSKIRRFSSFDRKILGKFSFYKRVNNTKKSKKNMILNNNLKTCELYL